MVGVGWVVLMDDWLAPGRTGRRVSGLRDRWPAAASRSRAPTAGWCCQIQDAGRRDRLHRGRLPAGGRLRRRLDDGARLRDRLPVGGRRGRESPREALPVDERGSRSTPWRGRRSPRRGSWPGLLLTGRRGRRQHGGNPDLRSLPERADLRPARPVRGVHGPGTPARRIRRTSRRSSRGPAPAGRSSRSCSFCRSCPTS